MGKGKYEYWQSKDGLLLLECWARDGLTDEQIAEKIGIKRSTLYDWKNKYSDISDALKKGKEVVDYEVENALLKRALGYEYDEEKIEVQKDRNGKTISTKVVQTVKQIPPDVGAIALWLKNRRSDKWRDRPEANIHISLEEDGLLEAIEKSSVDWGDDK